SERLGVARQDRDVHVLVLPRDAGERRDAPPADDPPRPVEAVHERPDRGRRQWVPTAVPASELVLPERGYDGGLRDWRLVRHARRRYPAPAAGVSPRRVRVRGWAPGRTARRAGRRRAPLPATTSTAPSPRRSPREPARAAR